MTKKVQTEKEITTKIRSWLNSERLASQDETIEEIAAIVRTVEEGMLKLTAVAKRYVKVIDEYPVLQPVFAKASDFVPERIWVILDQIGRGQLDARLACAAPEIIRKVSKVPLATQRQLISSGVQVRTKTGTKTVSVVKLTPKELSTVFRDGKIIPPERQTIVVEEHTRRSPQPVNPKYTISKASIKVYRADGGVYCEIPRAEIMQQMELVNPQPVTADVG